MVVLSLVFLLVINAHHVVADDLVYREGEFHFRADTPGGPVMAFGCGVELTTLVPIMKFDQLLVHADTSGSAVWKPHGPLPSRGYWGMVDLVTGRSARVVLRFPSSIRENGRRLRGGVGDAEVTITGAEEIPSLLGIWLVRPRKGAWGAFIRDGSTLDADGTVNGIVMVSLKSLSPVGESPPPLVLETGDLLFWVDLRNSEFGEHVVRYQEARQ